MLPKKERLTRGEFDRSFSLGKRYHLPLLQLIVDKTPAFHGAVVVGKKVHKKAVDRNKLRRQLYAVLYAHSRQHVLLGTYIIITKPAIKGASFDAMKVCLVELLEKAAKNL